MEWQPIETTPKNGTEVILLLPEYETPVLGYYRVHETYENGELAEKFERWTGLWFEQWRRNKQAVLDLSLTPMPTHWMPLPEAPE